MGIQLITENIDLNRLSKKDTLLNPSDRGLSGGGGLDRIVHSLGGKRMREACEEAGALREGECFVTEGFDIGAGQIIHAVVPSLDSKHSVEDLRGCYRRCLSRAYGPRILIPLLGTGSIGWAKEDSLECAWSESVRYLSKRASDARKYEILIFCNDPGLAKIYEKRKSRAFFQMPDRWGARGDIYYWSFLMEHFDAPCFSALDLHGFIKEMDRVTLETCGCRISEDMSVYVEKFAHGGMSSGYISGFWASDGLPLLCSRLCELGLDGMKHKTMSEYLIESSIFGEKRHFQLPKEILPDLKGFLREIRIL